LGVEKGRGCRLKLLYSVHSGKMDGFRVPGRLDGLGPNGFIYGACNGHRDRIVGRFCCVRPPVFIGHERWPEIPIVSKWQF